MADTKAPEDPGLPLGDIALDMVRRAPEGGPEKYIVHPKGPDVLRAAVEVVLHSGESREVMAARFRGVITVCYVLATKEGSPRAAETLADALFTNPKVLKALGGREQEVRARGREYRKFLDEGDMARAPQIGDRAPEDALKLTAFVSPGQQDMTSRVRKAAAKRMEPRFKVGPKGSKGPARQTPEPDKKGEGKGERRPAKPLPPYARKG